ncbi:MAG: hypothetical protein HY704_08485 [Gemmatimonadetes bacterium]|nr:hypothetical protein [Gemmatimonadota bacterium]
MRTLRKLVDVGLPIVGMVIVFAGVLLLTNLTVQVLVVLAGVLAIEAGVWQLTNPLLPNERRYLALRAEADRFIGLVREMNAAAVALHDRATPEARGEFERVRAQMLNSIDRMAAVAGRTEQHLRGSSSLAQAAGR